MSSFFSLFSSISVSFLAMYIAYRLINSIFKSKILKSVVQFFIGDDNEQYIFKEEN